MRKLISLFISITIIACSLATFYAKAQETQEAVNPDIVDAYEYYDDDDYNPPEYDISKMKVVDHSIYYLYNNEYACIEFFNSEDFAVNATEINIKDYIDGIPVTRVNGSMIFYKNKLCYSNLEKITIPNTVKTIGYYAFSGLNQLKELSLPDSITKIGERAFRNTNITEINIPRKLNYSPFAYAEMPKLKSITIPKELGGISECFFHSDNKLSKITFEESSKCNYVGSFAFQYCKSLKKIKLPDSMVSIEEGAFCDSGLSGALTIPKKCKTIKLDAFSGCKGLTKVNFKGKNVFVGFASFNACNKIKTMSGTENITVIEDSAFSSCRSLKSFTISKKLKRINKNAFENCSSLRKIKVLTTKTKLFKGKKIFKGISSKCKMYVKTKAMKKAVKKCGFKGKIIIKKNLK